MHLENMLVTHEGRSVAQVTGFEGVSREDDYRKLQIAVNAHDALVEVLREAVFCLEALNIIAGVNEFAIMPKLRAALTLADPDAKGGAE